MTLSVRESIEAGRIGHEDAVQRRLVWRPRLKQFEQASGIGHFTLDARMRPVAAPYQPLRVGRNQRLVALRRDNRAPVG